MEDSLYRWISLSGFFIISFIAWATGSKFPINRRTILGSIFVAWTIGIMTFWFPWTKDALGWINNALIATIKASQKGSVFLFGPLAISPGETQINGITSVGFILATQVLPSVIFFSALVSGLYYLRIMQIIVSGFAKIFYKSMKLSGAESLSASASIFVGIESSLIIRPYLSKLSPSELLTLMTCMMSTVASTVMVIYVIALKDVLPQIAGHLISASLISIPCAILVSKLTLPETILPETMGSIPEDISNIDNPDGKISKNLNKQTNLMSALIDGGMQGVKLAVGIATLLIVILGLEGLVDLILSYLPSIEEEPLTVGKILGWFTWPFAILIGLRPEEWEFGAKVIGSRFIDTEVTAYFQLAALQSTTVPVFSLRSLTLLTYTLCGFVHIASVGIFVGGLSALIPSRLQEITMLGTRSLWTAFLTTLLTGCIAGVLAQT